MPDTSYAPKGPAQPGKRAGHESADERHRNATIGKLKAELAAQATLIAGQEVALAHSRKIFDRASVAARIGVWECSLPGEQLHWTDVVYDLFDLPRGATLDRSEIIKCYLQESRKALDSLRSRAIAERSGFTLDAEITTFAGHSRWIRITATVEREEGVPVRIFGMKQDITEEKILSDRMRYLAEFDTMTGLANRARFQARLAQADASRPIGALLLIDLDGFKAVNDELGHGAGDETLRAMADILLKQSRGINVICRYGGDEFAVLLVETSKSGARLYADRIRYVLSTWTFSHGRRVTASFGIASLPEDVAPAADELIRAADEALYAAKRGGKDRTVLVTA